MALTIKSTARNNLYKEEAIKSVKAEKMAKLNVNVPKSLHSEFKIAAIRDNTDMTELIIKWIKEYIHK
jgi:hypothetical protein